jgi:hypothetical protein
MKKLILFLLMLSIFSFAGKVYAAGSTTVSVGGGSLTVSTSPTGKVTVTSPPATTARKTPVGQNFAGIYRKVYLLGGAIDQAGPKIAANLTNASGQLFFYLAVISLILWSIQNLMFGDKGIREFMLYFFFLMVVRGLLAGYNFFFVGGVAVFFRDLGQTAAGTHDSVMAYYGLLVLDVYKYIIEASTNSGSLVGGILLSLTGVGEAITALIFFFVTLVLLILGLIVLGTVVLVHAYIAIALISGYILVPFMIFKPLEFLWNGWLKFLITSCLSYFLLYVVMALEKGTLSAVASSSALNASPKTFGSVLAILFLIAIFAYLILKVPSIAGEIVSGMPNMSFSGIVGVAMTVVSVATMAVGGGPAAIMKGAQAIKDRAKGGGKKE